MTEDNYLKCANCEDIYTHVENVVWYRRSEDEAVCDTAFLSLGNNQDMQMQTNGKFNPSRRRDGLRVIFSCEACGGYSSLNISQHKGSSEVEVVKCPEDFLETKQFFNVNQGGDY